MAHICGFWPSCADETCLFKSVFLAKATQPEWVYVRKRQDSFALEKDWNRFLAYTLQWTFELLCWLALKCTRSNQNRDIRSSRESG